MQDFGGWERVNTSGDGDLCDDLRARVGRPPRAHRRLLERSGESASPEEEIDEDSPQKLIGWKNGWHCLLIELIEQEIDHWDPLPDSALLHVVSRGM